MYSEQMMREEGFDDGARVPAGHGDRRDLAGVPDHPRHPDAPRRARRPTRRPTSWSSTRRSSGRCAAAEVRRYTYTPGYQLSYLLGKVLILGLREEERRRQGADVQPPGVPRHAAPQRVAADQLPPPAPGGRGLGADGRGPGDRRARRALAGRVLARRGGRHRHAHRPAGADRRAARRAGGADPPPRRLGRRPAGAAREPRGGGRRRGAGRGPAPGRGRARGGRPRPARVRRGRDPGRAVGRDRRAARGAARVPGRRGRLARRGPRPAARAARRVPLAAHDAAHPRHAGRGAGRRRGPPAGAVPRRRDARHRAARPPSAAATTSTSSSPAASPISTACAACATPASPDSSSARRSSPGPSTFPAPWRPPHDPSPHPRRGRRARSRSPSSPPPAAAVAAMPDHRPGDRRHPAASDGGPVGGGALAVDRRRGRHARGLPHRPSPSRCPPARRRTVTIETEQGDVRDRGRGRPVADRRRQLRRPRRVRLLRRRRVPPDRARVRHPGRRRPVRPGPQRRARHRRHAAARRTRSQDEPVTAEYVRGTVAMAKTHQPNSAGSQFFVVLRGPRRRALGQGRTRSSAT